MLKPTPSSMNGDSRPAILICPCRRGRSRRGSLSSVLLPEPLRPTIPKNSPSRIWKETSCSAWSSSTSTRRNGCSARSFSVFTCCLGTRKVLLTPSTSMAAYRSPMGARGYGRRRGERARPASLALRCASDSPSHRAPTSCVALDGPGRAHDDRPHRRGRAPDRVRSRLPGLAEVLRQGRRAARDARGDRVRQPHPLRSRRPGRRRGRPACLVPATLPPRPRGGSAPCCRSASSARPCSAASPCATTWRPGFVMGHFGALDAHPRRGGRAGLARLVRAGRAPALHAIA